MAGPEERVGGGQEHLGVQSFEIDALRQSLVDQLGSEGVSTDPEELDHLFCDEEGNPRSDGGVFGDVADYCVENGLDFDLAVTAMIIPEIDEEITEEPYVIDDSTDTGYY